MLAHAFLDAAERLPLARLDDLLGSGGAVVVAPHPDDESLGCGSLIAAAVAEGRPVRVAIVSDGAGSHPTSRTYPPERLRAVREAEARAAAIALGLAPAHLTFLALPDRFVPDRGPAADAAAGVIAGLARTIGAGALFVTWRHDPHCDHRAAYAIARAAQRQIPGIRLFEYPIWGRSLSPDASVPEAARGWRLDGTPNHTRKQAAIACHRSQLTDLIADDPCGFRLTDDVLRRFDGGDEIFLEMAP